MKFAKINLIRILIGAAFAVLSAILLLIALIGKDSQYYMFAALPAIPAYLIGGGIGKAVKAAWKITETGWYLIPVFPADVLLAVAFFFLSLFAFFYLPIIFVGGAVRSFRGGTAVLTGYRRKSARTQHDT